MESNKRSILKTVVLAFGSINANVSADLTTPVNGAKMGQVVAVNCATLEAGLLASGFVSAAGVVTVRLFNLTGAPIDPANTHAFNIAVL